MTQYDCICLSMFKGFMNDYGDMKDPMNVIWLTATPGEYVIMFIDYMR